jgi:hypothetical protein
LFCCGAAEGDTEEGPALLPAPGWDELPESAAGWPDFRDPGQQLPIAGAEGVLAGERDVPGMGLYRGELECG